MSDLKQTTLSGVKWTAASRVVMETVTLGTLAVLARLLSPDDYGIFGMAMVVAGFFNLVLNLGLNQAIVHEKDPTRRQLSSLFWVNLGFSVVLAAVTIASAPLVAAFFEQPAVAEILMALAVTLPLRATGVVSQSLLRKELRFSRVVVIETMATIFACAGAVAVAAKGGGVWALVVQDTGNLLFQTIGWLLGRPWRPSLKVHMDDVRSPLRFGIFQTGTRLMSFAQTKLDDLLIGKWIGQEGLGIYQMAYRLMTKPMRRMNDVVGQVMVPSLTTIQDETDRLRRVVIRAGGAMAALSTPIYFGAAAVAPDLIAVLLGDQWGAAVPVFRLLCLAAAFKPMAATLGWIYLTQGRTDLQFKVAQINAAATVGAFLIGLQWGIVGVAAAYMVSQFAVAFPLRLFTAGRIIDLKPWAFTAPIVPFLVYGTAMAGMVWMVRTIFLPELSPLPALAAQIGAGAVVYGLLVRLTRPAVYTDVVELLRSRGRRSD